MLILLFLEQFSIYLKNIPQSQISQTNNFGIHPQNMLSQKTNLESLKLDSPQFFFWLRFKADISIL